VKFKVFGSQYEEFHVRISHGVRKYWGVLAYKVNVKFVSSRRERVT